MQDFGGFRKHEVLIYKQIWIWQDIGTDIIASKKWAELVRSHCFGHLWAATWNALGRGLCVDGSSAITTASVPEKQISFFQHLVNDVLPCFTSSVPHVKLFLSIFIYIFFLLLLIIIINYYLLLLLIIIFFLLIINYYYHYQ